MPFGASLPDTTQLPDPDWRTSPTSTLAVGARTHCNKAVVALANKLTRIVWAILTQPGTVYLRSKGAAAWADPSPQNQLQGTCLSVMQASPASQRMTKRLIDHG